MLFKLGEKNGKLVIKKQTYLLMVKEREIGLHMYNEITEIDYMADILQNAFPNALYQAVKLA